MDDEFESELLGRTLGGSYRIDERLGSGGMGAVFRASHLRTGRPYAVKVLLPEVAVRRDAMKRFRREAEAVGALGHANVVAIHDFDVGDGLAYIVMDLLEGEDLAARLERVGCLSLDGAMVVLEGLLGGLGAAHSRGIMHRDLKPANVFLARQPGMPERAVLLDFGLARSLARDGQLSQLTASGVVMGTPQYMSPEQASGLPLDERADLYAAATIFYECLAGQTPFSAPTVPALFAKLATDPPPPISMYRPDLPRSMEAVLTRALAKHPDQRFGTAAALLEAIRAAARGADAAVAAAVPPTQAVPASSTPVGNAAASWPRGHVDPHAPTQATPSPFTGHAAGASSRPTAPKQSLGALPFVLVAGLALVGLLVVGGGGFLYWQQMQRAREPLAETRRTPPRGPSPDEANRAIDQATRETPPAEEPRPVEVEVVDVQPPDPEEAVEPVEPQPARRRRRRAAPAPSPNVAPSPSAAPSPPPGPGAGPDPGVRAAVAHMERGDYQACVDETHRQRPTAAVLGTRMNCALQTGDHDELRDTCAEIGRRYPQHPYNQTCASVMRAYGISP